tara:strand:+ start:2970 stop:4199 length:1230 start_codon:yes stop_codon:yes gene_type:complete
MILILALISPFLCLIIGLKNYRTNSAKYYILVFILFYAFTLTFPEGETDMDFFRRIDHFNSIVAEKNLKISEMWKLVYSDDSIDSSADIFEKTLIFITSRFTDNYRWMSVVWGLIFGLFSLWNIEFIIKKLDLRINRYNFLWILLLFLLIPFWNINAFRFWTAAHIFINGMLRYFYTDDRKYFLLICISSVLVHFSFIIPNILLLLFLFLPKNLFVANIIFVTTIITSFVSLNSIDVNFDFLPLGIQSKIDGYTSIRYLDQAQELYNLQTNFYVNFRYYLVLIAFELMFLLIYFKHKAFLKIKMNEQILFLSFILLTFANLVFDIRPLDRFFNLGAFFMTFIGLKFWNYLFVENRKPALFRLCSILLTLYIIVEIRIGFDTISIVSILGNPITQNFLLDSNFSLIDLFK